MTRTRGGSPQATKERPGSLGPVRLLIGTTFLMVVGYGLTAPVIPLYASHLGFAAAQVGLVVAAYGFARRSFDLVGGVMGDRFGVRRMVIGGCLIASCGAFISATSVSGTGLLAGQVVAGVGSSIYNAAALTAVILAAGPQTRARALGAYHTVMIMAYSAGPIFGGLIADALGLKAPFFLFSVLGAAAAVTLLRVMPLGLSRLGEAGERLPISLALRQLLSSFPFVVALLVVTTGYMVRAGIRDTTVPIFAAGEFGMGASMIGLLSGVAVLINALLLPHVGRVLDRRGRRPATVWGCAGTGATLVMLAGVRAVWQIFAVMFLLGIASAYAGLGPVASLADLMDDKSPGASVGLQRMGIDLGMVVGPAVAGVSVQHLGSRSTFVVFAGLMFAVSALSALAPETIPRG